MFKYLGLAALAAACAAPAAATEFNLVGSAGSSTAYSYSADGSTLNVTGFTYSVAPSALTSLSQLTAGASITRADGIPGGLGIATHGEDGGETPQVDTNGAPNEVLRFAFANGQAATLTSVTFDYVDADDSLRLYGEQNGALVYLGFAGEFYDNTATDTAMGGGVTVSHTGTGGINNNWIWTVSMPTNLGAYNAYYLTSNSDSADGYQLRSISFSGLTGGSGIAAPVPEAATWLMMVLGFGAMGAAMRRPRRSLFIA